MCQKLLLGLLLLAPLAVYPFVRDTRNIDIEGPLPNGPPPLTRDEQMAYACFGLSLGQGLPAAIPWAPLIDVCEQRLQKLEAKAKADPIAFLQECLDKYKTDVRGYRCIFIKQEKVLNKMRPREKVLVHFKEKPFSVHMNWIEGRGKALRTLYVAGENDDRIKARILFDLGPIWNVRTDNAEAMATSRFPITEFGIYKGALSTLNASREADKRGKLHLKYVGIEAVKDLAFRRCMKFVRYPYDPPEVDGIAHMTFYIDPDSLMQVGSVLKDSEDKLIAEYFFRDIQINPTFSAKQFTDKSL